MSWGWSSPAKVASGEVGSDGRGDSGAAEGSRRPAAPELVLLARTLGGPQVVLSRAPFPLRVEQDGNGDGAGGGRRRTCSEGGEPGER